MSRAVVGRDALARLAAARGVACADVMRLGSLAATVSGERASYRDAVLALFRTEPGQHRGIELAQVPARIVLFEATEEAGVSMAAPADGLDVSAPDGDGRWIIATEALTVHLFADDPIELFVAVHGRPENEYAFRVHLSVALHRALFLLDRLYLHAAGVAHQGTGYAFLGDKGAGKSTLSLALGAAGATVLADDHVVLRRHADRFLVSGCEGDARLLDDAERHLFGAPVEAPVVDLGGVRKKAIATARFFASDPYREYRLDRLVFPHVGAAFDLRPLARREALVKLMRATRASHRFSGPADYEAYLGYLSSLVESVDAFSLELSPDLSQLERLVAWVRDGAA